MRFSHYRGGDGLSWPKISVAYPVNLLFILAEEYGAFVRTGDFSLLSIKRFSIEQNIPTYILIGRLQKDGYVGYYQYSAEKVKYVLEGS
jgi:hypothetical protein